MSKELEESTIAAIDFGKLTKIAAAGCQVVPVVLQNAESGDVLFVGYANEAALHETLSTKQAVLWSTSRNVLWRKGATSGDVLHLVDVRVNCEQNSLLYRVKPATPGVCHTKGADGNTRSTCYYRKVGAESEGVSLVFVDGMK
ncbi:MAG: phosphoribosyl-AMP cyclohydrolase [Planctomycetota bacterium]